MNLTDIRIQITVRRVNGETYKEIGKSLGISAPEADRIAHGKRPGKKVSAILGLDPSPALQATRRRIAKANQIARAWGFKSWSEYTTRMIEIYEQYHEESKGEKLCSR